jgi:hypothetical protein
MNPASQRCTLARFRVRLASLVLFVAAGCSPGVNTQYGRSRNDSINGTGVLAGLFRDRGHEVRAALRLTDELRAWADVIVRFSTSPGPPPKDEAEWYAHWLDEHSGRRVVYVTRDYDAEPDYWRRARAQLPENAPDRLRDRIDEELKGAEKWADHLPVRHKATARPDEWFSVKPGAKGKLGLRKPRVCKQLGGPWSKDVVAKDVALVRDDTLKAESETVLLTGDGETLVMSWTRPNDNRVLAVASGAFLLNAALATHPARAALAGRVIDWASLSGEEDEGDDGKSVVKRVAFVEGSFVTAGRGGQLSFFDIVRNLWPFLIVTLQCLALGVAATLSMALAMARNRREEPSGADRPVAHPEALGALLERTTQAREARSILETYRRWRSGPSSRPHKPGASG